MLTPCLRPPQAAAPPQNPHRPHGVNQLVVRVDIVDHARKVFHRESLPVLERPRAVDDVRGPIALEVAHELIPVLGPNHVGGLDPARANGPIARNVAANR